MYVAHGARLVVWAALTVLGAFAVGAGLLALANSVGDPVTRTHEVPAPALTTSSTVADANARFEGKPAQSIPGTELGLQGGTCDARYLTDGLVLVCHA
jgi:hypothetical protein